MLEALYQSITAVLVLLLIIGFGAWCAKRGWFNEEASRKTLSRLVNVSLPFFLFYSVTAKFSHDQLIDLLEYAALPFFTVGLNLVISIVLVKLGFVKKERQGTFMAVFTASTVLFVGVPLITAMFGADAIPFLLVYFFANVLFIWVIGLYCIKLDGARKSGIQPSLFSRQSLKMLMSPPLAGFLLGLAVVLSSLTVPKFAAMSVHYIGQLTSPLALIFVGVTVWRTGFDKLKHMPTEIWLVLFSCFVLRPLVMYFCTMPLDMEPLMRKVFILGASLPVSSVTAVLAKAYGGDEEFASEAIGASTVAMLFVLPVLMTLVNLI